MNKLLKKFFIIIITIVIFISVLSGIFWLVVPISRSHDAVRSYVLRNMPMGTSWDEAFDIIDDEKWVIQCIHTDCGLIINYKANHAKFALHDITNSNEIKVGTKSMFIELGEYSAPVDVAVFAYLAFDRNGKLVEVYIRKDVDSI